MTSSTSTDHPKTSGLDQDVLNRDSPLELTVHSLPGSPPAAAPIASTQSAEQVAKQARSDRAGRIKMLLVLLLCASPVIASYFMYYVVRPEGRRNYGELVEQRAMPASLQGQRLVGAGAEPKQALTSLRDQWLLLSVAGGGCDAKCERHLYLQRQLRETLGKEKDRLDWVWLVNDAAPVRPELQTALSNAQVWRVPPADVAAWLAPAVGQQLQDHLYVIDPIGNWMMRFPADIDPARAKRDLDRLMRASKSWDNAGRDEAAAAKLPSGPGGSAPAGSAPAGSVPVGSAPAASASTSATPAKP